jgi:peptidyl-prolyl cis-trans isomerase B (cyclophilin B)
MSQDKKLANFQAKQKLLEQRKARAPKDNRLAIIASVVAVAIAAAGQFAYFNFGPGYVEPVAVETEAPEPEATDPAAEEQPQNSEAVPNPDLSEYREWLGAINLNDEEVEFVLDGELAPQAVANFVTLAKAGFFEGVVCHRLVTEGIYVLQCGDPDGNGTGGPGYNWGPIENAPAGDLYEAGTLAMARRGGDGFSMGSQFFFVYRDSIIPSDGAGGYSVFGRVTAGIDVISAIAAAGAAGGASDGAPTEPVVMSKLTVE